MLLEVLGDQGLQQRPAGLVERSAIHQELGQGPRLVGDPGVEGGQEVVAADEVVLQCQDAEEEIASGRLPSWARPRLVPRRSRGSRVSRRDLCVHNSPMISQETYTVFPALRPRCARPMSPGASETRR